MDKAPGHEFQIGLTISAGAYTAGVLDFLVEALDAWEDARNGPNADTIPGHRVGIKVMSGGIVTLAKNRPFSVDFAPTSRAPND